MSLPVSYMGTKRQLVGRVREVIDQCPPGPLLDAFAGMCVIASAVGTRRQVWTNDFQHFAEAVALAHFCSSTPPQSRIDASACVMRAYREHVLANATIAAHRLNQEQSALFDEDYVALTRLYESWACTQRLPATIDGKVTLSTLFRDTFAGAYFSLTQAIEIDALRYSIDKALSATTINVDQHRWLILGLWQLPTPL